MAPSKFHKLYLPTSLTIKDTTVALPVAQAVLGDNSSLAKLFVRTRFPHRSRIRSAFSIEASNLFVFYPMNASIFYSKLNSDATKKCIAHLRFSSLNS